MRGLRPGFAVLVEKIQSVSLPCVVALATGVGQALRHSTLDAAPPLQRYAPTTQ